MSFPGSATETRIEEAVTQHIVEDDLEPVERGRLSFVIFSAFYKLWRGLYFITRMGMAYFALLASVLLSIAILNGIVGLIFNIYLPRALGLSSNFLVSITCFLAVLAFVAPIVGLVWVAFSMIPEVWSPDECPRSRLMIAYLSGDMISASMHTFGQRFSVIIQFVKLVTFIVVLIVSLVIGDGTYGVIETFVLSGCALGLSLYALWVPLVVVTEIAKYWRSDLLFPDTSAYASFSNSSRDVSSSRNQAKSAGKCAIIAIGTFMCLHGFLASIFIGVTLQEIGSTINILSFSVAAVLTANFITYWLLFSADSLDAKVIPSPNEEPEVVLRVEKNLKLLKIQPVPPRRFGIMLLIVVVTFSISVALLVVSNQFRESVFSDTCNQRSFLGLDRKQFPNGTRSRNLYNTNIRSSVCHQRWHRSKLNALDMAFLAHAAYEDNTNNRTDCINRSAVSWLNEVYSYTQANGRPGNDWQVRSVYVRNLVARYFELYSPSRDVTVFVVRGDRSDHTGDILETFDMYAPAGCFQFVSTFIPLSLSLPASKVSNLLYYVSFSDRLFTRPLPTYYQVVAEGIMAAFRRHSSHPWYIRDRNSVYVTGHSLGGAVAKVAGSSTGVDVTAISFNGPGLLYSARSFGVDASRVEKNVNNIVTTNDRFSLLLDSLGGSTFRVDCLSSNLAECHQMRAIICKLMDLCGFPDYNFKC